MQKDLLLDNQVLSTHCCRSRGGKKGLVLWLAKILWHVVLTAE